MIEATLFDCWGTLLQAPDLMRRGVAANSFHGSITARGCEIGIDEFRDAYIAEARRQHEEAQVNHREINYVLRIDSTLRALGLNHPRRRLLAEMAWADYLAEWPRQSAFFEGTPALLTYVKDRYRLGLITNFPDGPTARRIFKSFGFGNIFDSLVVSGEVGFRKPSRVIYERSLSELGSTPEKTVMVGDTLDADVLGPKEMGMRAILIDADGSKSENHHLPDAVVKSIGEVAEALGKL